MKKRTSRLNKNLSAAKREYNAARKLIAKQGLSVFEQVDRAHKAMLEAERELAAHLEVPYAVPVEFDQAWQWDLGDPCPTVIQTDYCVTLIYLLGSAGVQANSVATVEFQSCHSAKLGSPNDEVNSGHPLYGKGFKGYTALRVINSRWIAELEKINSVHHYYDPKHWVDLNHFIFGFHDSTFECVARSFEVTLSTSDVYTASKEALEKAFR